MLRFFIISLLGLSTILSNYLMAKTTPEAFTTLGFSVNLFVTNVVTGTSTLEPQGDFFRAVLINSELDACIRIEKINIRDFKNAKVKEQKKYCFFNLYSKKYSLLPSEHQDSEISNLTWNKFTLNFDLAYLPNNLGADYLNLHCDLSPRRDVTEFNCVPSKRD